MTMGSRDSSWFVDQAADPALEQVIQRICARVAPEGTAVHVADLPLGGVQVWVDSARHRWRVYHRMSRELRLTGWHTEVGTERLLVLGWSADFLSHRARMLGKALSGRLADHDRTALTAVMIATRLRHEGFPAEELAAEVTARCEDALRWPARLADLDGLERTSSLESLRLRLAQVAGLEDEVSRRCEEHLALASKVAGTVAGRPVPPEAGRHAGSASAADGGHRAGLAERMVGASVPNRPAACAGTPP